MTPPGAPAFKSASPAAVFEEDGVPQAPAKKAADVGHHRATGLKKVADATKRQQQVQETDAAHAAQTEEFVSENPDHIRKFGWVYLGALGIDPRIQRQENQGEVNNIARNFSAAALGTVTISAREDADGNVTFWLVDGQQRRAGALKAGYNGQVRADVHYGLTLADEARLFRLLNFRRSVQPVQLFKTALVEGDKDALAVQAILTDLGISFGTPRGFVGAKTALRLVHRRNGETTLRWAFTQIQRIYDAEGRGGCYDAAVVEAFFHLYNRFGSRIDETNLYNKLARVGGGTPDLIGQARTIKTARQGRLVVNVIRAILARYNHNKHAGSRAALPDWTGDVKAESELDAEE